MISQSSTTKLEGSKNLLAFSAGVDSTALFFILLREGIDFDIAIVDYRVREESEQEIAYAQELAIEYGKKIYLKVAPKFSENFEANAREFRYNFFSDTIREGGYSNLITAHHLNDKLEWLLMRLSKGAGATTLSGMQEVEDREGYSLLRPLLTTTKDELLNFLNSNSIKYFIDSSNSSVKYERNRYRPIVDEMLSLSSKDGYIRSFDILAKESNLIKNSFSTILKVDNLRVVEVASKEYVKYAITHYLKELGYLISYKELNKFDTLDSLVVGRVWAIEVVDNLLYIAPYINNITLPKEFKELCRKAKVPPKIRGYIYKEAIEVPLPTL